MSAVSMVGLTMLSTTDNQDGRRKSSKSPAEKEWVRWKVICRTPTNYYGFFRVDIVYDPVGLIRDSLKCIAWKGRAVVIGFAGGQIEKVWP